MKTNNKPTQKEVDAYLEMLLETIDEADDLMRCNLKASELRLKKLKDE